MNQGGVWRGVPAVSLSTQMGPEEEGRVATRACQLLSVSCYHSVAALRSGVLVVSRSTLPAAFALSLL